MSTYIIDKILAVRIGKDGYGDEHFIVAELGGDSNCFTCSTGARCRTWNAYEIGQEYEVIGGCCTRAGSFEGGMSRFARSKQRGTAEDYIRAYRRAVKEALPIAEARQMLGMVFTGRIQISVEASTNGQKWRFDELVKERGSVPARIVYYERNCYQWDFNLYDVDDCAAFLKHKAGRAFENVEVSGPDEK